MICQHFFSGQLIWLTFLQLAFISDLASEGQGQGHSQEELAIEQVGIPVYIDSSYHFDPIRSLSSQKKTIRQSDKVKVESSLLITTTSATTTTEKIDLDKIGKKYQDLTPVAPSLEGQKINDNLSDKDEVWVKVIGSLLTTTTSTTVKPTFIDLLTQDKKVTGSGISQQEAEEEVWVKVKGQLLTTTNPTTTTTTKSRHPPSRLNNLSDTRSSTLEVKRTVDPHPDATQRGLNVIDPWSRRVNHRGHYYLDMDDICRRYPTRVACRYYRKRYWPWPSPPPFSTNPESPTRPRTLHGGVTGFQFQSRDSSIPRSKFLNNRRLITRFRN